MEDWIVTSLGKCTKWLSGGTPSKANPDFWHGDIPWISAVSMGTTRIYNSELYISQEGLLQGSRIAPKGASLLLVRGGALNNKIPMGIAERDVAFNQDVKAIIADSVNITAKYVYIFLLAKRKEFFNLVELTGIGAGKLDTQRVQNIEICLPTINEQEKIASFIFALDDKIELNRRQNATLEAMAQAIFKEWFVDFGPVRAKMEGRQPEGISREIADLFPDRLDDEGKPEGWERKKLGDLITFYSERIKSDKLTESNYVSTENMLSDKKGITKASSLPTTDSVPAFCTGHILVSNIRPYFKKIWFATFDGGRSNDVLDFCPLIVGTNYFIFNVLICDAFFDFMMQTAKGSKMPRGDKNAIMAYPVVAPTEVLQRAYSSLVEVYYKKINNNVLKNEVLTSLRDTLLPKLISGELRVPDAEKMVADIV